MQISPAAVPVHPARFAAVPVNAVPVTSNFMAFVAEFVGVTVSPTALAVLVRKFTPAWDVLFVVFVWKGIVQVEPSVQVCELTVVAAFVSPPLPSVPLNPA